MDPGAGLDAQTTAEKCASVFRVQGGMNVVVSAIPKSDTPANDYDPAWMLGTHPSAFPHNTGARPDGMSEERWAQCILRRYPSSQFAQNVGLIADLFDCIQRHSVNKNAWVQVQFRPDQQAAVSALSEQHVQAVLDAIASRKFGADLNNVLDGLPEGARTLYNGVKAVGGRVIGTPQSFLSLRSKVLAANTVFGAYTCQLNLSPSELGAKWTFDLAGEAYEFDYEGRPTNRPHLLQCKRIIAANPVACADFLMAYLRAFTEVFCGWPMGSDRQTNPNSLFGIIYAMYLKYESSQRGGLHAHGQTCQPFLQVCALVYIHVIMFCSIVRRIVRCTCLEYTRCSVPSSDACALNTPDVP